LVCTQVKPTVCVVCICHYACSVLLQFVYLELLFKYHELLVLYLSSIIVQYQSLANPASQFPKGTLPKDNTHRFPKCYTRLLTPQFSGCTPASHVTWIVGGCSMPLAESSPLILHVAATIHTCECSSVFDGAGCGCLACSASAVLCVCWFVHGVAGCQVCVHGFAAVRLWWHEHTR